MNPSTFTPDSLPFAQPGSFYRGNIHGHSTESDGDWTPDQYIRNYRQNGYDFVAITDHCLDKYGYAITDSRHYRDDSFTTLLGAELHPGRMETGEAWHLLAVGLPLDFETHRAGDTGRSVAQRAMAAGAFVAATHPNWYAMTVGDYENLGAVHAIECYNGGCDVGADRGYSWHYMDMLLHRGHRFGAIATDDLHGFAEYGEFMRGWIYVKAQALEPYALLEALKAGHYYASTGAQLYDVAIRGDKLSVACSPARQVLLHGERPSAMGRVGGERVTTAEFDLADLESRWLRVTVVDENGGRAWTNPIWLD